MLTAQTHVQLDKLSAQRTPTDMLPTGYWLRGWLIQPPEVGSTLQVLRYERAAQTPEETAPVKCAGIYVSSPVRELLEDEDGVVTASTANSHWRITPLPEEDARAAQIPA